MFLCFDTLGTKPANIANHTAHLPELILHVTPVNKAVMVLRTLFLLGSSNDLDLVSEKVISFFDCRSFGILDHSETFLSCLSVLAISPYVVFDKMCKYDSSLMGPF